MKSPCGLRRAALAAAGWSRTSVIVRPPVRLSGRLADRSLLLRRRLLGGVVNGLEAAPEHALAGERHLAFGLQALVGHNLFPRLVADFLVGPFDEREDDLFALFGLHGAVEVGDFALGHVVRQSLDDAGRAM